MSNTLKLTSNYGNPYEQAKARLSRNNNFREDDWLYASKGTSYNLDSYISALDYREAHSEEVDKALSTEYGDMTYATSETRIGSMVNEMLKKQLSNNTVTQERYVTDDEGNQIYKDGKPVTEKYLTTEYDYYKSLIKESNRLAKQEYDLQVEQERKDNMNGFVKFLGNVAAVPAEIVSGFASVVDGFTATIGGIAEGTESLIKGEGAEGFSNAYTEAVAGTEYRTFDDLQNSITEFESRYTGMRTLDGNYSNWGRYVGGISYTVGQLLPSILLTKGLGATAGTATKVGTNGLLTTTSTGISVGAASAASQIVYYTAMSSNNLRDMYNHFAEQGASVPTWQIMLNAGLKSTLEFGVEKVLGKILGGTQLDNMVFGRSLGRVSTKTSKSLTTAGMKRVLKEFGQEGLEEVLQDTSSFLTDQVFMNLINENFGEITDLTFQSLMDAFVIGGLVSFGGSCLSILKTDATITRNTEQGGKIAAWEYGLNLQSFVENFNKVNKVYNNAIVKKSSDASSRKYAKAASAAMYEMYASYRILSSIYGEIGEQRFSAASKILDKITDDINNGKYNVGSVKIAAKQLYDTIYGDTSMNKEYDFKKLLEKAKAANHKETVTKEDVELSETESEQLNKEVKDLMDADDKLKKVHVVEDGENVVVTEDGTEAVVPEKLIKNAGSNVVLHTMSENELCDNVLNNSKVQLNIDKVIDVYNTLVGRTDASKDEVIRSLLFDEECKLFDACLLNANKDMYDLLTSLITMLNSTEVNNKYDAVLRDTINKSIRNMKTCVIEYLTRQFNAKYQDLPFLEDSDKKRIAKEQWCKGIYSRVIKGEKLSKKDMVVLKNRINYATAPADVKNKVLENIVSSDVTTRADAMDTINTWYKNIFTTEYDGKTYPTDTSIPNKAFINYLKSLQLNLTNFVNEEGLNDTDITYIKDNYGDVNLDNIVAYRIDMFSQSVNGMYSLEYSEGIWYVTDKNGERIGFSNYKSRLKAIYEGDEVILDGKTQDRKIGAPVSSKRSSKVLKSLINKNIDIVTSNMLNISDVVKDSKLLDDDLRKDIIAKYGNANEESTFMYLRKYIANETKNISITLHQDGDYSFVSIANMKDALAINDFATITSDTTAKKLFKGKYLTGMNEDLRIVLTDEPIVASFSPSHIEVIDGKSVRLKEPIIKVNSKLAKEGGEYFKFALLHELQHAIQYENRYNLGMDDKAFEKCNSTVKDKIIADLKKHKPDLFVGNPSRDVIESRVSKFIYNTSSESQAMGLDTTDIVDFYPTLVEHKRNGTHITFPWGSTFNLDKNFAIDDYTVAETSKSNTLNNELKNVTSEYSLEDFNENPKSVFVMPDGTLRTFDKGEHYDIIKSINETIDYDYWDSVPQIVVDDDFASVKIRSTVNNDAITTVLSLMDTLYDKNFEFYITETYYEDADPYAITVMMDEANNSDELLDKYSRIRLKASNKMSLSTSEDTDTTNDETTSYLGTYTSTMSLAKLSDSDEDNKLKSRYVSQKEAKGTALEPWTGKGVKKEISPELKSFILSTDKTKVAKSLQKKVDDGTITTTDVMEYFGKTDLSKMDKVTFRAINNAYFHNDIIKTPQELQYYIDHMPSYYAAGYVAKGTKNEAFMDLTDPDLVKAFVESVSNADTDSKVGQIFAEKFKSFYYKGKPEDGKILDIDDNYLKMLWMEYFDGSLLQAKAISNIIRNASSKNNYSKDVSMDTVIGEDLVLGDTLGDDSTLNEINRLIDKQDKQDIVKRLKSKLSLKVIKEIAERYGTSEDVGEKALQAKRIIDNLSKEQLNEIAVKQLLSDLLGLNFDTIDTPNIDSKLEKIKDTPWSVVDKIKYHVRKIQKYLPKAQYKLFLKHNSDLFTDDLKLREDLYKTEDVKGRLVYKSDVDELNKLFERLFELGDAVKDNKYSSSQKLSAYAKHQERMQKAQEEILEVLKGPVKKAREIKTLTVEIADDVINIDTSKPLPKALERILDFEFSKLVKSRTQYLTNEDDYHYQTNIKTFMETNIEYLEALTQQDVEDIIDFYANSVIRKATLSESKYSLYNAVQIYLSSYILRGNKMGSFTLTDELKTKLTDATESVIHIAAQKLANWKSALKLLEPEKVFINALAKSNGLKFSTSDIEALVKAVDSGDIEGIKSAKKNMYENALKNYKGRKKSFWDKIYQFERVAMLSGPGTWVRSWASNAILDGVYIKGKKVTFGLLDASDVLGEFVTSKILVKLFPKRKWKVDNQYKIFGTKVTSDVNNFLKTELIDSGLLTEILDGLNTGKYDVRKFENYTGKQNLATLIMEGVKSKVFYSNNTNIKVLDDVYKFVGKMLSDDKYVTRSMLKYLGKILTETNADLSKGITSDISKYIVDAYTLAARDFMHKPNIWNKFEQLVKNNTNPATYFAYKQVFTFAPSSWNWFTESLNYTPYGIIKGIFDFAHLEDTVEHIDKLNQKGANLPSSRFAEYLSKRRIGKGIIGSIGIGIGILLIAFGVAKLDEEDDKYKLHVGDISVDISKLYGTQSIFMGMAITSGIIDKDKDFFDVMNATVNSVMRDNVISDVWTTMRYNETFGEYVVALPVQILNNMVPNFLKTISDVVSRYDVKYSKGILGKIERIAVNAIPGLAYAMPKQVDVYTGEYQVMYKANFITELVNKLSPLGIEPLNQTDTEKLALELGIHKTNLTGRYTINEEKVNLTMRKTEDLNEYYGKLNKQDLDDLVNNKIKLKVKTENGNYKTLYFRQMTEKQKRAAFEQIMSENSSLAKVKILTSMGYKYYANDSEYYELKKLGITNVYKKTNKLNGFVKN